MDEEFSLDGEKKSQKEGVKYVYCYLIFRTQCGTSSSSRNTLASVDDSHVIAENFENSLRKKRILLKAL